jgi:uncharacterized membrane protein YjgN (DUF898 family)
MWGISIKAVVLASLAVIGIDIVSGIVLAAVFGGPSLSAEMTDEQLREAAAAMVQQPGYLTAALILGTASTVLGGYLAARLARTVPYFNALAFGVLGAVLGLLTSSELPTWFRVVGLGLTVPAALIGAYFAKRQFGANRH